MAETKKKTRRKAQKPKRFARRRHSYFTELMDAWRRYRADDFRPDNQGTTLLKLLHLTKTQRQRYLRWGLYIFSCVAALVLQDAIMSRVSLFHATTDLPVAMILLITVMEGSEIGSLFALIASVVYHFSGSAPGPYCVAFLTLYGTGLALFRQKFWHRSAGSIILCAAIAVFFYEMSVFAAGLWNGVTLFRYGFRFVLKALYTAAVLIPLYPLVKKIGLIGGNVWKE